MDPASIIALGIGAAVLAAIGIYQCIKKKNKEIEAAIAALETYSQTYAFESCDVDVINRVSNYLRLNFKNDYESVFNSYESLDEKKVFFQKVAMEIAAEMQLDLNSCSITSIDDFTRGYTNSDGKSIVINEVLLIADPKQAVITLCHELRHCMQFQAINDNKWGFSPERLAAWLYSFQRYSESQDEYVAYVNTIVEVDANKFANKVVND